MSDLLTLNAPEIRTTTGLQFREVEATESGRFLEGRAVPYGVWQDVGWYMERFQKGAFKKSIREAANKLPLLLFHNAGSFPVGVSERWTETDDGLDCVWRMDTSELAQEATRLAKNDMLTGLSVGFVGIQAERTFDEDAGISYVDRTEARLLEVSLTPTPAYAGAQVATVRSREPQINGVSRRRSSEISAIREWLEKNR